MSGTNNNDTLKRAIDAILKSGAKAAEDDADNAPRICRIGHLHGIPGKVYGLELHARLPAGAGTPEEKSFSVFALDVMVLNDGGSNFLNRRIGTLLDPFEIQYRITDEGTAVWSSPWRKVADIRKAADESVLALAEAVFKTVP